MEVVDYQGVGMSMTMSIGYMRVIFREIVMVVFDHLWIVGGPHACAESNTHQSEHS